MSGDRPVWVSAGAGAAAAPGPNNETAPAKPENEASPPRPDDEAVTATTPADGPSKPVHCLILDTGPLIKNDPPADTLRARAATLYTTPAVLAEIRDEETRSRVETTLRPFLTVRTPRLESVAFVRGFARKTGDIGVLSKTDMQLIALTYEIEVERNGCVRRAPLPVLQQFGRAREEQPEGEEPDRILEVAPAETSPETAPDRQAEDDDDEWTVVGHSSRKRGGRRPGGNPSPQAESKLGHPTVEETAFEMMRARDDVAGVGEELHVELVRVDSEEPPQPRDEAEEPDDDDDDDGDDDWITPENVQDHLARDLTPAAAGSTTTEPLDTALLTSDFAMQNVALRIGLAIVSPALARITTLKTWVLRCHGCFAICRDTAKQFCPRCGQATLIRTSCSTDEAGRFRVHLKRNMQWNNRGNVYSIPKPTHGSASGKPRSDAAGGGKNGWGRSLILAGDQKEYVREAERRRREKAHDPMDEDYLPGILSGERGQPGGRIRIGAGRSINSKKTR